MSGLHVFTVYDPIHKGQVFILRRTKGYRAYKCVDIKAKNQKFGEYYNVYCKDVWPQWWYFWMVGLRKFKKRWTREWKAMDWRVFDEKTQK